jgi:N-terminal domain of galactosyltransferase
MSIPIPNTFWGWGGEDNELFLRYSYAPGGVSFLRPFYFHAATHVTQWHLPTSSEAKDRLKAKQRADRNK